MSNIDEKLREILEDWYPGTQYSYVIPRLKQAFADEGYLKHDDYGSVKVYTHKATNVMTGQDWYNRFEKEVEDWPVYKPINPARKTMLEIAKRAAGLS